MQVTISFIYNPKIFPIPLLSYILIFSWCISKGSARCITSIEMPSSYQNCRGRQRLSSGRRYNREYSSISFNICWCSYGKYPTAMSPCKCLRCPRLLRWVAIWYHWCFDIGPFFLSEAEVPPILLVLYILFSLLLQMVYYSFAIVGMEVFGNKIPPETLDDVNCGLEALENTEFARMGYCRMNFNNILNSYVTLFILMVVNQWHDILLTSYG